MRKVVLVSFLNIPEYLTELRFRLWQSGCGSQCLVSMYLNCSGMADDSYGKTLKAYYYRSLYHYSLIVMIILVFIILPFWFMLNCYIVCYRLDDDCFSVIKELNFLLHMLCISWCPLSVFLFCRGWENDGDTVDELARCEVPGLGY